MLAQKIALIGGGDNSQDYLEKIFDAMSDALLITNSSGKIEKINRATVELFGYQEAELIGNKLSLIFANGAKACNLLPRILLSQDDVEIVCETKTGEKLELAFSFSPIPSDKEDTPDFICIARNITSVKQLEIQLQQKEKSDRLLRWLTQQIHFSSNLEEILNRSSLEVRQFFGCSRVLIYQFQSHIVAQSHDDDTTNLSEEAAYSLYAQQMDISVLEDIKVPDLEEGYGGENLARFQVCAELVLPIWHGEQFWGVLVAHQCGFSRQWEQWEIDTMGELTAQLGIAIKMAGLHKQVQKLAFSDELTNLANQHFFHEYLSREWRRLLREQQPLSLILFDIDYFKAYNDGYGHLSGDFCLQAIAEIVGGVIKRAADLAARFGDDQLAIILPNTDIKGAVNVAKMVRSHVKKAKIPHLSSPVAKYLTLSVGVVTMVPQLPSTPEKLVNTALRSLSQAKKQGRDRIVIANW